MNGMENAVQTLSTDINVITAEINAYQRVAGEAIFEIGRRVHEVKYNPRKFGLPIGTDKEGREIVARGSWGEFLNSINMNDSYARKFETIYIGIVGNRSTLNAKGMSALYEIATMVAAHQEQPHTIPSTGETKTVDDMTVRELREVKAELKKSQEDNARKDAVIASKERSEEILTRQNERLSDELSSATKPETVVVEKEVERIVEVDKTDYSVADKLRQYEERFGALENYSDRVRGTNLSDVTTSVMTFSKAVRELVKRHAYLLQYQDTVGALDVITRQEYDEAVEALQGFAGLISPRTIKSDKIFDAVIIEQ